MSHDVKSERAQTFWLLTGLPRWEQVAFSAINIPFGIITMVLGLLLWLPFHIMILLQLPFLLWTMAGSLIWMCCLGVMLGLSFVTEKLPVLRPISFILALPFLIVAHNLNGLTPAPSVGDMQAKLEKWDLVEAFPWTWSLFRFSLSGASPVE